MMDIEKLIEQLQNNRHPNGLKARAAAALSTLQIENQALRNAANGFKAENEKLRETVDKYATAARAIALHLKPFCDESLPYDEMIADAARKASDELEQVKGERDAAIKDIWVPKWTSCKNGENCSFVSAVTGMPDCAGCDNWEWRGPQKEN